MPAVDNFAGYTVGRDSPAPNAAAISPSDEADLNNVTRAIYVGTQGDLTVTMKGGGSVTFTAVPAGTILPIEVTKVWDTGTDAEDLVALW